MKNQSGLVALLIGIAAMLLSTTLALSAVFVFLNRAKAQRNIALSYQSFYAEEAGMEDALYRVAKNKQYLSSYIVTLNNSSVSMTISGGNTKTVTGRSDVRNVFRSAESIITQNTTQAEFFYGVQVGEGGVTMGNNSRIQGAGGAPGNFYSNGPVVSSGTPGEMDRGTITGDVTVATGVAADAQHSVYNSDFSFGESIGSSIVRVDTVGDVGEYSSLALGADGFARISYYDATTAKRDLKFARCTNADCTTRNITTVDAASDVGSRYSSLALGSDGFARISYWDQVNNDLKFARCTNDDCTTKNIRVVDTSDGQYSSLALGADGFARISYYDGDLNYARCLDADCTTRNITEPDSVGDTGQYTSIALGSDGFARISYINTSDRDLKFVRCTNDDCTAPIVTVVDSVGTIHRNTSLVIGIDGFARISYMDDGNDDLKVVRCMDADCVTKVITTVATDDGAYSSLKMGSDGFPRISYYTGDLKFVRCTNLDCTTKVITTPDSAGDVGRYTSLRLSSAGFARIAYYDASTSNRDLKYVRCSDIDCPPGVLPGDAAQSFQPTRTQPLSKGGLYLRKVGSPSDATIRINADSAGSPANSSLVSVSLPANLVGTSYGWVEVSFQSPITVTASTTYWLVFDGNQDATNYYVWGYDSGFGYPYGIAKYSEDWNSKPWFNINGDMNFRVYLGTGVSTLDNVIVYGTARANTITRSSICGNAYYQATSTIDASSKTFLDSPTNPTCGGNPLTPGTGFPGQPDPPVAAMPISDSNINQWKADATAGGVYIGDFSVTSNTSLGPREIAGNLLVTTNNRTLTVTGTIYVRGNIDISGNGSTIQCDLSFGARSCVLVADGWVHSTNNVTFRGSGQAGSYIMILTTLAGCNGSGGAGCTHHDSALDLHNNATGAIFYAVNSQIYLHNGVNASELVANKLVLSNNAIVTYESGLANSQFQGGPGASWRTNVWREIE